MRVEVRSSPWFSDTPTVRIMIEVPIFVGTVVAGVVSTIVYVSPTRNRTIRGIHSLYVDSLDTTFKQICRICDHQNEICGMSWCSHVVEGDPEGEALMNNFLLENDYLLWPKTKGSTWLEDTLKRSQERFKLWPEWLQESARSEDRKRRSEAMELYKGEDEPTESLWERQKKQLEKNLQAVKAKDVRTVPKEVLEAIEHRRKLKETNEKHEERKAVENDERDDLLYALQEPSRQSIAYYTKLGELKLNVKDSTNPAVTITACPDFFCISFFDHGGWIHASSQHLGLTELLKMRDFIDQIIPELLKQREVEP